MGEPDRDPDRLEARRMRTVQTRVQAHAIRLDVRRCRLECVEGPDAGKVLVSDKEQLRIGTDACCDLVLADRSASRQHCELVFTERGYRVADLGSTNGTFLDGRRIERAYLTDGAKLLAGETLLRFSTVDETVTVAPDPEGALGGMIGRGLAMRQLFALIRKVAPLEVPVVISGETGTGKELAARALHDLSGRSHGPFVVLDCGALRADQLESELFGHEKGAFPGATAVRAGAFERAHGGTLLLDAVGELRVDLQPRLLRVLENRELRRLGGNDLVDVDVRVIAATHRDLLEELQQGNFRDDLYYRLSVIQLQLPALRERPEDLPLLLDEALAEPELVAKVGTKHLTEAARSVLQAYPWPGNVRELRNVVAHAAARAEGPVIDVPDLPPRQRGLAGEAALTFNEHLLFKDAKEQLLEAFEREYLGQLLRRCEGNVSRAARESGLHRKSIERLIKKYQLDARSLRAR